MTPRRTPAHFVVDGSNIATEGRSTPSLAQLNEAVLAFMEDFPGVIVTVVVDATFGHRIEPKEVKAFDEAVANNELVAPPAGAVGRGDAFVLTIANKANAGVLSNDSFQEFHGEFEWLFEEGRLIGGKPVPNVGWVFVPRAPVRGPKSRRAVRESNGDHQADKHRATARVRRKATAEELATAEGAPPPNGDSTPAGPPPSPAALRERTKAIVASGAEPTAKGHVNELGPFLDFVERHPVGTTVSAVVDSYSSHGAYARVGDVLVYVPLRLMDEPPPTSARRAMQVGTTHELVIVGFVPDRRSIDAARPHVAAKALPAGTAITPSGATPEAPRRGRRRKAAAPSAETVAVGVEPAMPGLVAVAEPAAIAEPAAAAEPAGRAKRRRGGRADAAEPVEPTPEPADQPAATPARGRRPAKAEPAVEVVAGPLPEPPVADEPVVATPAPTRRGRKAAAPAVEAAAGVPAVAESSAVAEPSRRRRGTAAEPGAAQAPARRRTKAAAEAPAAAEPQPADRKQAGSQPRGSRARKQAAELTEADVVSARARARRRPAPAAAAAEPAPAAKPAKKAAAGAAKRRSKES